MARGKSDDLFETLRARGLRTRVARTVTDAVGAGKGAGGRGTKAAQGVITDLRSLADEIEDRLTGGKRGKRKAAAQKAARTRAKKARERSASAKKGAATRAKATRSSSSSRSTAKKSTTKSTAKGAAKGTAKRAARTPRAKAKS